MKFHLWDWIHSAGVNAFAGARASVGLGVQGDWICGNRSNYGQKAARNVAPSSPCAIQAWILLSMVDASEWLEPLFDGFDWSPSRVTLLPLEGALEGSFGVGGPAVAELTKAR